MLMRITKFMCNDLIFEKLISNLILCTVIKCHVQGSFPIDIDDLEINKVN